MPVGLPPVRPMPTTEPFGRMAAARFVSRLVAFACAAKSRCGVDQGPSADVAHESEFGDSGGLLGRHRSNSKRRLHSKVRILHVSVDWVFFAGYVHNFNCEGPNRR